MALQELLEKRVSVITSDGRNIIGLLKGYDQVQNLVLFESHERLWSEDKPLVQQVLGLYLIRGDNM
jgi:U6 snRNA-associated Sm-like protein LSm8